MSKKIISAILCLLLISFAVYADGVSVSVVYDTETDSVSVSGNADSDVTVTVLKNGTEYQCGKSPGIFQVCRIRKRNVQPEL